jgi:hypothetical protein
MTRSFTIFSSVHRFRFPPPSSLRCPFARYGQAVKPWSGLAKDDCDQGRFIERPSTAPMSTPGLARRARTEPEEVGERTCTPLSANAPSFLGLTPTGGARPAATGPPPPPGRWRARWPPTPSQPPRDWTPSGTRSPPLRCPPPGGRPSGPHRHKGSAARMVVVVTPQHRSEGRSDRSSSAGTDRERPLRWRSPCWVYGAPNGTSRVDLRGTPSFRSSRWSRWSRWSELLDVHLK